MNLRSDLEARIRELQELLAGADHTAAKYWRLMRAAQRELEAVTAQRDWHALQEAGLRDDIGNLEAERDEALAVIAEVREFASEQATEIRRQYGRTGPAECLGFANACEDILDILSRITDKEQN